MTHTYIPYTFKITVQTHSFFPLLFWSQQSNAECIIKGIPNLPFIPNTLKITNTFCTLLLLWSQICEPIVARCHLFIVVPQIFIVTQGTITVLNMHFGQFEPIIISKMMLVALPRHLVKPKLISGGCLVGTQTLIILRFHIGIISKGIPGILGIAKFLFSTVLHIFCKIIEWIVSGLWTLDCPNFLGRAYSGGCLSSFCSRRCDSTKRPVKVGTF
mmetsp:Transcript_20457/g.31202  ORF Transcript_20457/g.31202 Transcript_20457/m.31202 type:complete len:215 (+) Transcript_20457:179-823(+)